MNVDHERIYTFLGFAQKAGKAVSGENTVAAKIKEKSGRLLVIAADAPAATDAKMTALAKKRHVPYVRFGEKARLGNAIGKSPRNVVLIADQHIAKEIWKQFH